MSTTCELRGCFNPRMNQGGRGASRLHKPRIPGCDHCRKVDASPPYMLRKMSTSLVAGGQNSKLVKMIVGCKRVHLRPCGMRDGPCIASEQPDLRSVPGASLAIYHVPHRGNLMLLKDKSLPKARDDSLDMRRDDLTWQSASRRRTSGHRFAPEIFHHKVRSW